MKIKQSRIIVNIDPELYKQLRLKIITNGDKSVSNWVRKAIEKYVS